MKFRQWNVIAATAIMTACCFTVAEAGIVNGRFEWIDSPTNQVPYWAELGGPYQAEPNSNLGDPGNNSVQLRTVFPGDAYPMICIRGMRGVAVAQEFHCDGSNQSTCYIQFDYKFEENGGGSPTCAGFVVIDGSAGRMWAQLNGSAPFVRRQIAYPGCGLLTLYYITLGEAGGDPILYIDNVENACDEPWAGVPEISLQDFPEVWIQYEQCTEEAISYLEFNEIFREFEGVPTLHAWPIVALVMFLLAGGVVIIYRRRRVTA